MITDHPNVALGIGLGFALLFMILAARFILNTTKWWLCPWCFQWHNEISEVHPSTPMTGELQPEHKPCLSCCRLYNDSL